MRRMRVPWIALTALLAVLVPAAAFAQILRAPEAVIADANGNASFNVTVIAEAETVRIRSTRMGGPGRNVCGFSIGDGDCYTWFLAPGDSVQWEEWTRLCNPAVPAVVRILVTYCDQPEDTVFTTVYPHTVASAPTLLAEDFSLRQHPNPVAGRSTFHFALPGAGRATLRVYDLLGRLVARPLDQEFGAGHHSFEWNVHRDDGSPVRPGVYLARIEAGGQARSVRFIVAR